MQFLIENSLEVIVSRDSTIMIHRNLEIADFLRICSDPATILSDAIFVNKNISKSFIIV